MSKIYSNTNYNLSIEQPVKIMADNPTEAIRQSQKFGSINPKMLSSLFTTNTSGEPNPKVRIM